MKNQTIINSSPDQTTGAVTEAVSELQEKSPGKLLRDLDGAIRNQDQARACAELHA